MIASLPRREREIFEILCSAGEATAADDPRGDGRSAEPFGGPHPARPAGGEGAGQAPRRRPDLCLQERAAARQGARDRRCRALVKTFFDGSAASAATALLGLSKILRPEELEALQRAIDDAGRSAGHESSLSSSEMAWKSALISGGALALAAAPPVALAAPTGRWCSASGSRMLLLLPLISWLLPALRDRRLRRARGARRRRAAAARTARRAARRRGRADAARAEPTIWDDPTPLVLLAYLGGLAMVGVRLLAGLWPARPLDARGERGDCPRWLAAFEQPRWAAPATPRTCGCWSRPDRLALELGLAPAGHPDRPRHARPARRGRGDPRP